MSSRLPLESNKQKKKKPLNTWTRYSKKETRNINL